MGHRIRRAKHLLLAPTSFLVAHLSICLQGVPGSAGSLGGRLGGMEGNDTCGGGGDGAFSLRRTMSRVGGKMPGRPFSVGVAGWAIC